MSKPVSKWDLLITDDRSIFQDPKFVAYLFASDEERAQMDAADAEYRRQQKARKESLTKTNG